MYYKLSSLILIGTIHSYIIVFEYLRLIQQTFKLLNIT